MEIQSNDQRAAVMLHTYARDVCSEKIVFCDGVTTALASRFRRRGLDAFLVQDLKRLAYALQSIPWARCNTDNVASRMTLQKAGVVPYAHLLSACVPTS